MTYKTGWEETPEMKKYAIEREEIIKKLNEGYERERRKEEILMGVALFFFALSLSVPLIVRLIK